MDDHWKFRRGGGVHFQRVLSEVPISNLLGGGGHERPPGMENLGRGGAHQRVFCGGWGGGGYGYFLEVHISNPTENNISVLCPKIMGNHQ